MPSNRQHYHPDVYLVIHKTTGLLNFLGGDFKRKKLDSMPFGEVVNCIIRNGGEITIGIKNEKKS